MPVSTNSLRQKLRDFRLSPGYYFKRAASTRNRALLPMDLLTERALNEAFLDVVEKHRREGLPVVVRREGHLTRLPVDQLIPEITRARNRIAELSSEIAKYQRSPFSVNETPE